MFVVVQPDSTSRRIVHLGWIEDMDDEIEEVLIMFGEAPPPAPPVPDDDSPFDLERPPGGTSKKTSGTARPGQPRFAFHVMSRYGARCAVCEVSVKAVLECNHLRAYAQNGSDDPRNGLVLCRTHHRAFEKHLFGIDPSTLEVSLREEGPSAAELAITRTSIAHLPALPHVDALTWCWDKFSAT